MDDSVDIDFDESNDENQIQTDPTLNIEEQYKKGLFRVVYQYNTFFIPQIISMIGSNSVLNLQPEYQRRLRWDNKRKSLLIESLLLNIPVPPLFFYEKDMAIYEVMDGQQRLTTVNDFYNNAFRLTGLSILGQLDGLFYKDLHPIFKKGLDRAALSVNVLLLESEEKEKDPYQIRRYVFERINTGGIALNNQEIRNSLYSSEFNNTLLEISRENIFTACWDIPPYDQKQEYDSPERKRNTLYKNMYDCQLILRFFALINEINIRGSMKSILDRCMQDNLHTSREECLKMKDIYLHCLQTATRIFGDHPFNINVENKRKKNSAPLYDAIMVALYKNKDNVDNLVRNSKTISFALDALLLTEDGYDLFVGRGNTAANIKDRIRKITTLFSNIQ
ncbi:hypothetical protein ASZ90_000489 [hydrocarbon metagenome]|uniref:GmrSD restriction endonucleases N-terminal domain-containing protein n=1 Tax=hydrocarbon metagenome TaxID=938273 RepID=A0A0W8G9G9_9ZZZZ